MTELFADVDPLRRKIMAAVRGRDKKPGMIVLSLIFSLRYCFRLHRKDLPSRPNLVFPARLKAIYVHGCFWHRQAGSKKAITPKTRIDFWNTKFDRNVERDHRSEQALADLGWTSLVVWERETRIPEPLASKLRAFLCDPSLAVAAGGVR